MKIKELVEQKTARTLLDELKDEIKVLLESYYVKLDKKTPFLSMYFESDRKDTLRDLERLARNYEQIAENIRKLSKDLLQLSKQDPYKISYKEFCDIDLNYENYKSKG